MKTYFVLYLFFFFNPFSTDFNKDSDSALISEVEFKDGVYYFHEKIFNGDIVDYYENEKLKFRYGVLDGRLNGVAQEFYVSGEVKSERTYYMNKLYGSFTEFFINGDVKAKFDVKLNAYEQGELIENITIGEQKKGRYKSKGYEAGIIYFINPKGEVIETSENISILNQTKFRIFDSEGKKLLIEVL